MKTRQLQDYIEKSELRTVNDNFMVRLSTELAVKYDNGEYDTVINLQKENLQKINNLGIVYPAFAKPIYYLYIVPRDAGDVLGMPNGIKNGGCPVACFDIKGFPMALGMTEGVVLQKQISVRFAVSDIHEFAHLVTYMFFINKDLWILEGIAEAFPYYLMDSEQIDNAHRELISNMNESDILDARTLAYNFTNHVDYSKSVQEQLAYVSSYLLVRGILKQIQDKYNCDKVCAMQKFMEFVRAQDMLKDFLIWEIADFIDVPREVLHTKKSVQLAALQDIRTMV